MAIQIIDKSPFGGQAIGIEYDPVTLDVSGLVAIGRNPTDARVIIRRAVGADAVAVYAGELKFSRDGGTTLVNLAPLNWKMRWELGRVDEITGLSLPDRLLKPTEWAGMTVEWRNPAWVDRKGA